jgi:hypothetical protein
MNVETEKNLCYNYSFFLTPLINLLSLEIWFRVRKIDESKSYESISFVMSSVRT